MRILHLLNWPLRNINYYLDKIASQHFNAIQINPLQPLKEDGYRDWWMSYQPCGFNIGNIYGSKDDLIELCNNAEKYNIRIFADVICNHMAGSITDELEPHEKVDQRLKDKPAFWKPKKNVYNWDDRKEVTSYCMRLPGLNVSNSELQSIIIDFLNEFIDCGVTGFRFDAAKSIALPEEGNDFWAMAIYCLKRYGMFLYGEVIFASQELVDNYCKYMNVLTNSCGKDINRLVGYAETHDTYLSGDSLGYTKNISSNVIAKNYKNLCEVYPNTLFYARPYDDTWQLSIIKEANKLKVKN